MDQPTLSDTEEFSRKSKVDGAKPSSTGFILSMHETNRRLCVFVPVFQVPRLLAGTERFTMGYTTDKILMCIPPIKVKKTTIKFFLIPAFAYPIIFLKKTKRWCCAKAGFWIHLGLFIFIRGALTVLHFFPNTALGLNLSHNSDWN